MFGKNLLTRSEAPSAVDLVTYNFISDPLSIRHYEVITIITA